MPNLSREENCIAWLGMKRVSTVNLMYLISLNKGVTFLTNMGNTILLLLENCANHLGRILSSITPN